MKILQQRSQLNMGSRGSISRPLGAVAPAAQGFPVPRQPAHTTQPLMVCTVHKKNNYYDFDDSFNTPQMDNFDYYPNQAPAEGAYGNYTQTLWDRPGTATMQGTQRYPAQQPRYSAQRGPLYLPPQDMSLDEDDDYLYPEDAIDYADNSDPSQRTVNGRQLLINNEIKSNVVRVIAGEGGKVQKGVMSFKDAMIMAKGAGVDLVLLNSDASPPLCRLVVWSKYKYEIEKGQKKKAVKAVSVETKEIRLRPGTDVGDLQTKIKSAQKFLDKGHKVKLVMKFEGRELQHKEQGKAVMLKFVEDLGVVGKVDGPINFKTGTYTAMVSPTGRALKDTGSNSPTAPAEDKPPAPPSALPPSAPPAAPLPLPPRPVTAATPGHPPLPPPPAPVPVQPTQPSAAPAPGPARAPLPMPPMGVPVARPSPSPVAPSRAVPPLPQPLQRPPIPGPMPSARPGMPPPPAPGLARPAPMRTPMAAPLPPPRQPVPASYTSK